MDPRRENLLYSNWSHVYVDTGAEPRSWFSFAHPIFGFPYPRRAFFIKDAGLSCATNNRSDEITDQHLKFFFIHRREQPWNSACNMDNSFPDYRLRKDIRLQHSNAAFQGCTMLGVGFGTKQSLSLVNMYSGFWAKADVGKGDEPSVSLLKAGLTGTILEGDIDHLEAFLKYQSTFNPVHRSFLYPRRPPHLFMELSSSTS